MVFIALALWLSVPPVPSPVPVTPADAIQNDHFLAFVDGVANARWGSVVRYVRSHFPIGTEAGDHRTRKTYEPAQVLAGTVPFPACDAKVDLLACAAPRDSGRVTCTCTAGTRVVSVDFQQLEDELPQLIGIQEKR